MSNNHMVYFKYIQFCQLYLDKAKEKEIQKKRTSGISRAPTMHHALTLGVMDAAMMKTWTLFSEVTGCLLEDLLEGWPASLAPTSPIPGRSLSVNESIFWDMTVTP